MKIQNLPGLRRRGAAFEARTNPRTSKWLMALAIFGLVQSAEAQFSYSNNGDGTCTITAYTGAGGAVTIPDTINGLTVTSIGGGAFDSSSVTSVVIPNNITNIGVEAFGTCLTLTAITVDAQNSFYSSTNGVLFDKNQTTLVGFPGGQGGNYTIPNSVTNIEDQAFYNCIHLAGVTFGSNVTSIGFEEFFGCSSLTNLTIPASVTSIGQEAFFSCNGLTGLTIANSVTNIGPYAFEGCSSLASIMIPASVTSIAYEAFGNCAGLHQSYFLGNVPGSGFGVFTGDSNLVAYYLYGTTGWGSTFGGVPAVLWQTLFNYTTNNSTITITDYVGTNRSTAIPPTINGYPVTSIGGYAFSISTVTSVAIPNSVTSIETNAFFACTGLTGVTIPNSVTNIGYEAFAYCQSLTSVIIPANVTSIGNLAFEGCTVLTAITVDTQNSFYSSSTNGVLFDKSQTMLIQFPGGQGGSYTIPGSVTSIGQEAFYECASLAGVTIGANVTSIGDEAFSGCAILTSVTIPNTVTSLGVDMFDGCSGLTSVTLPDRVTSIGNYMFYGCTSLTSLTIPASVTSIQVGAFEFCDGLRQIYFKGNSPGPNGSSIFAGDTNLVIFYLPRTTDWGSTFGGFPAVLWNPLATALGISGGHFGFNITGPTNVVIVVEASTNLANSVWLPVSTNTLSGSGASSFSDSQSGNYPKRFYRFRSP